MRKLEIDDKVEKYLYPGGRPIDLIVRFTIEDISSCEMEFGCPDNWDNVICPGLINGQCFGSSKNFLLRLAFKSNPNSRIKIRRV